MEFLQSILSEENKNIAVRFFRILVFIIGFNYYLYMFLINFDTLINGQFLNFELNKNYNIGIFDLEKKNWTRFDIINDKNIFQLEFIPRSYPLRDLFLIALIESKYTYQKILILDYVTIIKFPSSEMYNISLISNNMVIHNFQINISMQRQSSLDSFFDCRNASNYLRCRIMNTCITPKGLSIFGYQHNISTKIPIFINPKKEEIMKTFRDENSIENYTFSEETAIFSDIQSLPVFFHSITESIFPISSVINDENLINKSKVLVLNKPTTTRLDLFKILNTTVREFKNYTDKFCYRKIIVGLPEFELNLNPVLFNEKNRKNFRETVKYYIFNSSEKVQEVRKTKNLLFLNRPLSTHRSILNYKDLLKALNSTFPDWKITYTDFSKMSLKDQIKMVSENDILLTIHGSGLSHMLFMNDNAFIIEIYPYLFGDFFRVFNYMAEKTNLELVQVFACRNSSFPRNENQRIELENNRNSYHTFIIRDNIRNQIIKLNETEISLIINILKNKFVRNK